jgi:EAL domain-containing protein (putative c-di-GMP-specific phosphodiesterase class I)
MFYEGLIRVLDDTGRIIPARDFMGNVEERDLGRRIDCAALVTGLRTLKSNPGLRLAINMSAGPSATPNGWASCAVSAAITRTSWNA